MNKKKMRNAMISQLKKQTPVTKRKIEAHLVKQLLASKLWREASTVGITVSEPVEWDTKSIIEKAWRQGKIVCVPKANPERHVLNFHAIDSFSQLEISSYGLSEPILGKTIKVEKEAIDLMIVPGVVFDKYGFRIGFGGGYYDRFLADFSNETCSLLAESQLVNKLPVEAHDIPVHYLITEKDIHKRKTR